MVLCIQHSGYCVEFALDEAAALVSSNTGPSNASCAISKRNMKIVNTQSFLLILLLSFDWLEGASFENNKRYERYVERQLEKSLDRARRVKWLGEEWKKKLDSFQAIFHNLIERNIVSKTSKILCVGARTGQETLAWLNLGVEYAIGVDLVPRPPLVVKGDMHSLPFEDKYFDVLFSNAFDHSLLPNLFAKEARRVLKNNGVAILHISQFKENDAYSANRIRNPEEVVKLFLPLNNYSISLCKGCRRHGLDTELVFFF